MLQEQPQPQRWHGTTLSNKAQTAEFPKEDQGNIMPSRCPGKTEVNWYRGITAIAGVIPCNQKKILDAGN